MENKTSKKYSFKKKIRAFDRRFGLELLERLFFANWFNPFATFWLNIRSFPICQAIKFPIWCYGRPRFYGLSGEMKIDGKVSTGMIRFNQVKQGAPSNMSVQSEILNQGLIIFHGKGIIGTGNKIRVTPNAVLDIGKNFKICDMCNVGCFKAITIGEGSWITHRCQVLDTNYHFVANFEKGIVPEHRKPIHIGKGCWVCNNSSVTGGAVLPDYTIVASNSLVSKDYTSIPASSMIGGIPARLIATGFRKIENSKIEGEILHFYSQKPDEVFRIPDSATPEEYSYVDYYR